MPLPRARPSSLLLVVSLLLIVGCKNPVAPVPALELLCPTVGPVSAPDGAPVPVTFQASASGGVAPVEVSCTPASGSAFGVGTTAASCVAVDAARQSVSCGFMVTVVAPPRLVTTKFVAFGDSITEGKQASGQVGTTYPMFLAQKLAERYAVQATDLAVVNAGCGGETIAPHPPPCVGGVTRLSEVLTSTQPGVVMIQEGVNDLALGQPVAAVMDGLRAMVREAKQRGVHVLLATLTPLRAGGTPPRGDAALPHLAEANAQIAALAAAEAVDLVDVYAAFGGPDPYIDVDGLHPTQAGYEKMADTFLALIQQRFEVKSPVITSQAR